MRLEVSPSAMPDSGRGDVLLLGSVEAGRRLLGPVDSSDSREGCSSDASSLLCVSGGGSG